MMSFSQLLIRKCSKQFFWLWQHSESWNGHLHVLTWTFPVDPNTSPMTKKTSKDSIDKIKSLSAHGFSVRQIAKQLSLSKSVVQIYSKNGGISKKKTSKGGRPRKIQEETLDTVWNKSQEETSKQQLLWPLTCNKILIWRYIQPQFHELWKKMGSNQEKKKKNRSFPKRMSVRGFNSLRNTCSGLLKIGEQWFFQTKPR